MPDEVERLVSKHAARGVFVDTNMLVLLLVGTLNPSFIPQHKRTRQYTVGDFEVLENFVARFKQVVATPHVLAEVGNIGGQIGEPARSDFFRLLASSLTEIHEEAVESRRVSEVDRHVFPRLGLTDSLTLVAAKRDFLVLSDDLELVVELTSAEADVVNFTHLRPLV